MADEITVQTGLSVRNGTFTFSQQPGQIRVDQATAGGGNPGTLTIATSDTAIDLSDMTAPGYLWVRNLDDTNYVEIGPDSGGTMIPLVKLKAGEVALFRLAGSVTLKAKANTAACEVQLHCVED